MNQKYVLKENNRIVLTADLFFLLIVFAFLYMKKVPQFLKQFFSVHLMVE